MATEEDVRRICLDMHGVSERSSWGQPAWFAKTLMARIWEAGVVTVKTNEREALGAMEPDTYFWTPHHQQSPNLMLIRLENIDVDELDELLQESYRIAGAPGKPN
ncbi:MmcQ/YjbR family DNA-binding protein [Paenarthrobacter sp. NPDC092416]|uniref:MmcQ/YjbR family DNA-binding protein n=1 Tax=Paenarthrobacter sp. NPDC092416 TaxID=3364386 RepID=UPI0037F30C9E